MWARTSAATALIGLGTSTFALAADLPAKAPIYKAPVAVPASLWTGFYVGGNVGYSWGPWDASSNQLIYNFESSTEDPRVNGVNGGVQLGYNWQLDSQWLVGVEADIQISGEKKRSNWTDPGAVTPPPTPPADFVPRAGGPASLSSEWKFPWFGTARLRGGFLASPNWLIYATGGVAFGETKYSFDFSQPGAAPFPTDYSLRNSSTRVGFAVGAGTEVKIDANWSVKFEYLFVDLSKVSIDTVDIDGQPFSVSYKVRDHIARVGANYRF